MARNIKAGVAYVDVALGSLKEFLTQMQAEMSRIGTKVVKPLQDELSKVGKDPAQFANLTGGIKQALVDSGDGADVLREKLRDTGKQGGDAFVREFNPILRKGIEQSTLDNKDKLLALFDAGQLSPTLTRTLRQAVAGALDEITPDAEHVGEAIAEGVGGGVERAAKRAESAGRSIGNTLQTVAQRIGLLSFQVTGLGYAFTALTAPVVAAVGLGAAFGIKTAASLELAEQAFESLLDSASAGQTFFRKLVEFANKNPIFDLENTTQFAQRLLSAGVAVDRILPSLTALSTIAARYGINQEQTSRAVTAFSQVLLKNKVYAEELQQIQEAGIPIYDLLARAFHKSAQQITDDIKNGRISAQDFYKAIVDVGNSAPFVQALANRTNTLAGAWDQFKASIQQALAEKILSQLPKLRDALKSAGDNLKYFIDNTTVFDKIGTGAEKVANFVEKLSDKYRNATEEQKRFFDNALLGSTLIGPALIVLGGIGAALSTIVSFGAGAEAILGAIFTPAGAIVLGIGIVAGLVGGLVFGFSELRDIAFAATQRAKEFIETALRPIGDAIENSVLPAIDNLVTAYREDWLPIAMDIWTWLDQKIIPKLIQFADAVGTILAVAITYLAIIINTVLVPALDWLSQWWDKHGEQVRKFAELLEPYLIAALIALAVVIGVVAGVMLAVLLAAIIIIGSAFISIITIIGWVLDYFEMAKRKFGEFKDAVGAAVSAIGGFFHQLYVNVLEIVNGIIKALSGVPLAIRSAFDIDLYSMGVNIIQGLINGIEDRVGGLLARAHSIASQITAIFQNAFIFGSPSKVTTKWGRWIVQGLIVGMGMEMPRLDSALDGLAMAGPSLSSATSGTYGSEPVGRTINIYPQRADFNLVDLYAAENRVAALEMYGRDG